MKKGRHRRYEEARAVKHSSTELHLDDIGFTEKVPETVLDRTGAVTPRTLLDAGFWHPMIRARRLGLPRTRGWEPLRAAVERAVALR